MLVAVCLPWAGRAEAAGKGPADWPNLAQQLKKDRVVPGSALERLIEDNQEFNLLRPEEANDKIQVPAWLRVMWRKAHPEVRYSAKDPTGGYPHALKEIHEWLLTHQDMLPGLPEEDVPPPLDKAATVGTNLRISGAQTVSRSESDIRINFFNPTQVIAASNNIGGSGQQGQYYSSDSGATWGQTTLPLQTGDSFHSDPAVDWRSDGSAWAATMGINSAGSVLKVQGYKSTTAGQTWSFDGTISGSQTNTDKELIWIDHSATSSFKDNIYVCWHNGNPAFVNRRTTAWGTPIQVSGAETTGTGIGCDVKTNSAGDVFMFYPDTGSSKIYYVKSTNGGVSWSAPAAAATTIDSYDIGVPSFNSRRALIYASGAAYKSGTKDNVYVAWTDLTGATGCTAPANEPGSNTASTCKTRIWVARSTNGGSTWSKAMINNQASLNDQYNQWLAVDETTGRVSVMYYDTVNDAGRKKVDVYYQSSSDDGATWSTPLKVTTAMTDETSATADSGNQFGDYNGLSGYNNKFFPSWTDHRNNAKEEIWTAPVTEGGTATPDFSISASPSSVSVVQGNSGTSTVSTSALNGFNSSISLSASGAPAGVTVSFSPTAIAAPGTGSSTATFAVAASTTTGTYTITITGTGGSVTHTTTVNLTVTSTAVQQLLGNPGFETGTAAPWVATSGVINNSASQPPHGGSWDAWLDGYGTTHTDSIYQDVTIPSTATTATLTFWLHIDSAETTTTTAFDTLKVQVRNTSNTVLSTLATYSNLNKAAGYSQKSFNLISFKGQTVRIYFLGVEDSSLQTSFVLDDTALNVQ
jgi:hypothetical protein